MKSFTVQFHKQDNVDLMNVQKLTEQDFTAATEGGTRKLFELDTNIGYFVFFDGEDKEGAISYLVLQYEEESEVPNACYSFEVKDFYEFMALYLQGIESMEETEEGEEEYGAIHHLAHLLHHISEDGKTVNP